MLRLEETHQRDIQEVREDVTALTDRVSTVEASFAVLEGRVAALEQTRDVQQDQTTTLQLHLEEIKDWSRRNNLRLWGLPEATGMESLEETAVAIFRKLLGTPSATIERDRIHRALGPRSRQTWGVESTATPRRKASSMEHGSRWRWTLTEFPSGSYPTCPGRL